MRVFAWFLGIAVIASASTAPVFAEESTQVNVNSDRLEGGLPASTAEGKRRISQELGRRPRIGLALGGGGTRGAAHIGVLKVLEENHIPIDYICGTSIGSVVGGFYASGVSISRMQQIIRDRSLVHAYVRTPIALQVAALPLGLLPRGFGKHSLIGIASGKSFQRFIEKQLPENSKRIEDTQIPFAAVATDLQTGNPFVLRNGSMSKALEASSAVPFLKRPVKLDGRILSDGFVCGSNLPAKECRDMGADVVICVNIDGPLQEISEQRLHHYRTFRHRIATIILSRLDAENAKDADVMISPDVTDVGLLSKRCSEMDAAIQAGIKAAQDAMPKIQALLKNEHSWRANIDAQD